MSGLHFPREQIGVGHRLRQCAQSRDHFAALLPRKFLRFLQPVVSKHARQKPTAISGTHGSHRRQIFLAGEVGREKLTACHAKPLLDQLTDGADAVCDWRGAAIHEQLGRGEAAHDTIAMRAQFKVELCAQRRARGRAVKTDRFACSASDRIAVQRPRDPFENGGLAGTVRPDDAGEASLEFDLRVDMLAEILQSQRAQSHGVSESGRLNPASVPGSLAMAAGSLTRCR